MNENCYALTPDLVPAAQRIIKRALTQLEQHLRNPGVSLTSVGVVRDWLRLRMAVMEREAFIALYLDNQNRLLVYGILFIGSINSTEIHSREVMKSGLKRCNTGA